MIGAGPCGLGAVRELAAHGVAATVLEAAPEAGGLGGSVVDAAGFTWDRGGHVVFSHHGEFDRLLDEVMGDDVLHHDRSSWILTDGTWVPYPFQNNLQRLPPERARDCLVGLVEAATGRTADPSHDFERWSRATFGDAVVDQFMAPYNHKVWGVAPAELSATWIAERVSLVDWRSILGRVVTGTDDLAWGPNNRFSFPAAGGTGEIWRRAAAPFADRIRYGSAVVAVEPDRRVVTTADGAQILYDHLVSTMALDRLVPLVAGAPTAVAEAAASLVHQTVAVVGLGYEAPVTDDRSWLYFADLDVPCYRATNFAKYAPANVPGADTARYSSWMCEVGWWAGGPVEGEALVEAVDAALRRTGLVAPDAPVASRHLEVLDHAYPVPTPGRDAALRTVLPWLDERAILSRGRFGTWRYEVGNMDHAVKMGIDAARRILGGAPEELVPADLVAP